MPHRARTSPSRLACALCLALPAAALAGEAGPGDPPLDVLRKDGGEGVRGWRVSTWEAGQSGLVRWAPENVRWAEDGALELVLDSAPGQERPVRGGEIQSRRAVSEGIWRWRAQAPRMVPGAVFGMFLFQADHRDDPWLEYDLEFVGQDTTRLQIDIHMETEAGERVSLGDRPEGPEVVRLPFDAAEEAHDYAVEIGGREAAFRVDGEVVARFGPGDMPGGVWREGALRSFVDIWAVSPAQHAWAGVWSPPGRPLVARIEALKLPDGAGAGD